MSFSITLLGVLSTIFSLPPASHSITNQPPTCEEFVIHGDNKGHFRGQALVNGISMPFLIDTGASITAVPKQLAKKAGLPEGQSGMVETANGLTEVKSSKINELKIGNAVLKNTDAFISESLEEVLIGMTALKHFEMRLGNNTLFLNPNSGYDADVRQSSTWKKNVVCNQEGKECKTAYSK